MDHVGRSLSFRFAKAFVNGVVKKVDILSLFEMLWILPLPMPLVFFTSKSSHFVPKINSVGVFHRCWMALAS